MNKGDSYDEIIDITSHHEAGHLAISAEFGVSFLRFERFPKLNCRLTPDPSYKAKNLEELYVCFLCVRASRFSQKLSQYNSPDIEIRSFGTPKDLGDDQDLEGRSKDLLGAFQKSWTNDHPSEQIFHGELLRVADVELTQVYSNDIYKTFVRNIASNLRKVGRIEKVELDAMLKRQLELSGVDTTLNHYDKFSDTCLRLNSSTASDSDCVGKE